MSVVLELLVFLLFPKQAALPELVMPMFGVGLKAGFGMVRKSKDVLIDGAEKLHGW